MWLQQALQQQAHEALQANLSAMQGLPSHNTNQGYFGKGRTCSHTDLHVGVHVGLHVGVHVGTHVGLHVGMHVNTHALCFVVSAGPQET